MTDYMTNVVHPSFSNLLVETNYDEDLDTLIATKRKKTDEEPDIYVYSKLVGIDLEKDVETEKQKLIKNDLTAYDSKVVKYPLWPTLSYRASIILEPYERQDFYYIVGASESKYNMKNAILKLDKIGIEKQFKLSHEINSVVARYLKLEPTRAEVYNNIIKDVLFSKLVGHDEKYWDENLNQSLLWKYSISGDLPIILVYIDKIEKSGIVNELINFMDYVKNRKIDLDIVILIDEEQKEFGPIYTYVKSRLDRAVYMDYSKGNIFVLNIRNLTKQEVSLLSFLSKKYIQSVDELLCINPDNDESPTKLIDTKENNEEVK